ncbi:MAG TPA: 16S rRNA (uracil(1498)-N(3))-methyltransferase [Pirellulaceae bacterium]|nr:16S rRNA (uracil(1498)-N(3))-methyltransferase [Pirellulaceae bacterium]
MSQRFFVARPIDGERAVLVEQEAHHLLHVMRGRVGDEVVLFDGSGAEFDARVVRTSRSTVDLEVTARREVDRETRRAVTLGIALPKGDRQKWLIEKAVELGVTCCVPLETRRGVAQPESSALERLRKSVVEASKQCGRNRLMELREPMELAEFLSAAPADATRWFAHPPDEPSSGSATPPSHQLELSVTADSESDTATNHCIWLVVGPEGGFTDEEATAARQTKWRSVGLGPRILRIETAALALVAVALAPTEWT